MATRTSACIRGCTASSFTPTVRAPDINSKCAVGASSLPTAFPLSLGAQLDVPQQSSAAASTDIATLARMLLVSQAQHAEQLRQQQAASTTQLLLLRSLGELQTFSGRGDNITLTAQEWIQRTEDHFAAREDSLGIDAAQGDLARVLSATNALVDDARRWYNALPQ
jgi:hypothetical protein